MDTTTSRAQWEQEASNLAEIEVSISILIGNPDRAAVEAALPTIREAVESLRVNAVARAEGR